MSIVILRFKIGGVQNTMSMDQLEDIGGGGRGPNQSNSRKRKSLFSRFLD